MARRNVPVEITSPYIVDGMYNTERTVSHFIFQNDVEADCG